MASVAVAPPQAAAAPPKSPPKLKNDKGKLTELHGEPPIVIKRNDNGYLTRGRMLGEGGFARVYAATDSLTGLQKAVKVISKEQLKSTKTKSKVGLLSYPGSRLYKRLTPHDMLFSLSSAFNVNSCLPRLNSTRSWTTQTLSSSNAVSRIRVVYTCSSSYALTG